MRQIWEFLKRTNISLPHVMLILVGVQLNLIWPWHHTWLWRVLIGLALVIGIPIGISMLEFFLAPRPPGEYGFVYDGFVAGLCLAIGIHPLLGAAYYLAFSVGLFLGLLATILHQNLPNWSGDASSRWRKPIPTVRS